MAKKQRSKRFSILLTILALVIELLGLVVSILTNLASNELKSAMSPSFVLLLTVLIVVVCFGLALLAGRLEAQDGEADPVADQRSRQLLLDKIEAIWITGMLAAAQKMPYVALSLHEQRDAVKNPLGVRQPSENIHVLASWDAIVQVYRKAGNELLLLGEAGAGKTVLLLVLASDLLQRARKDATRPIPVVFNLTSWAVKRLRLIDWLAEELSQKYHLTYKSARKLLETDQILPLLDGLDEVPRRYRTNCVEEINAYRQRHGGAEMVVCSRRTEYMSQPGRLSLNRAFTLLPLTKQQIDTYIANTRHQGLGNAVQVKPALYDLAITPFMLNVLALICGGQLAVPLLDSAVSQLKQKVFTFYIQFRLSQNRGAKRPYSAERTIRYVKWLAQQLDQHNQNEFYIEFMQFDWWHASQLRRLLPALAVGLIYGMLTGIGFGISYVPLLPSIFHVGLCIVLLTLFNTLVYTLFNGIISGILAQQRCAAPDSRVLAIVKRKMLALVGNRVIYGMLNGLLSGVFAGILVNVVSGLICGLFTCAFCAGLGRLDTEIKCAPYIEWSWSSMMHNAYKFLAGGLVVGIFYGLVTGRSFLFDPAKLLPSLILGFGVGLIVGVVLCIKGGFSDKVPDKRQTLRPNQGIRDSIGYSLRFGLFFGAAFGLIFGLVYGPALFVILGNEYRSSFPTDSALIYGLSDGFIVASFFWLSSAGIACIQHMLLRLLIWRNGYIPWRYIRFLDYAADLALLCKVGGGYMFYHKLLQEYFVELEDPQKMQPFTRPSPSAIEKGTDIIVREAKQICSHCGHERRPGARYCYHCGEIFKVDSPGLP